MSKLIETPYGRKTPELLCKAMDAYVLQPRLIQMIEDLETHLDYCGWGRDRWERECGEETRKGLAQLKAELARKDTNATES